LASTLANDDGWLVNLSSAALFPALSLRFLKFDWFKRVRASGLPNLSHSEPRKKNRNLDLISLRPPPSRPPPITLAIVETFAGTPLIVLPSIAPLLNQLDRVPPAEIPYSKGQNLRLRRFCVCVCSPPPL